MYSGLLFFDGPSTTEIYTLSLHDALPISSRTTSPTAISSINSPCSTTPRLLLPPVVTFSFIDPGFESLDRSEEHTSELQSQFHLVCRLLLEKNSTHVYY